MPFKLLPGPMAKRVSSLVPRPALCLTPRLFFFCDQCPLAALRRTSSTARHP